LEKEPYEGTQSLLSQRRWHAQRDGGLSPTGNEQLTICGRLCFVFAAVAKTASFLYNQGRADFIAAGDT
jgi:hypothetical protein